MNKVMPIEIDYQVVESSEGEHQLQSAYNIIFLIARDNLLRKGFEPKDLTDKYIKVE